MNDAPIVVICAHPDDWQIFAGAEIYRHLRERRRRVGVIVLTAGEGKHGDYHWQSRHSGAIVSLLRALPAWDPYASAETKSGYSVTFERVSVNGHSALQTTVADGCGPQVLHYALHLPDAGKRAPGTQPSASLTDLKAGAAELQRTWPNTADARPYESWGDLVSAVRALIDGIANGAERVHLYAHDWDPAVNANDHPDHAAAGSLARDIAGADARIETVWFAGYDVRNRAANLRGDAADLQRAAVFSYGGGYTANASELTDEWVRGWEPEFEAFGGRHYLRKE